MPKTKERREMEAKVAGNPVPQVSVNPLSLAKTGIPENFATPPNTANQVNQRPHFKPNFHRSWKDVFFNIERIFLIGFQSFLFGSGIAFITYLGKIISNDPFLGSFASLIGDLILDCTRFVLPTSLIPHLNLIFIGTPILFLAYNFITAALTETLNPNSVGQGSFSDSFIVRIFSMIAPFIAFALAPKFGYSLQASLCLTGITAGITNLCMSNLVQEVFDLVMRFQALPTANLNSEESNTEQRTKPLDQITETSNVMAPAIPATVTPTAAAPIALGTPNAAPMAAGTPNVMPLLPLTETSMIEAAQSKPIEQQKTEIQHKAAPTITTAFDTIKENNLNDSQKVLRRSPRIHQTDKKTPRSII